MEKIKKNTGMHVCMHFFVFVIKSIHRKKKESFQNTAKLISPVLHYILVFSQHVFWNNMAKLWNNQQLWNNFSASPAYLKILSLFILLNHCKRLEIKSWKIWLWFTVDVAVNSTFHACNRHKVFLVLSATLQILYLQELQAVHHLFEFHYYGSLKNDCLPVMPKSKNFCYLSMFHAVPLATHFM